jgi:hypothetical protein
MLRSENPSDFLGTLKNILISVEKEEEGTEKAKNVDRILLKQSLIGFIGNLCNDP